MVGFTYCWLVGRQGAVLLRQGPSTPKGHVHMHSGYRGGVMEVGGLTVQPPCCIVSDAASDQTAWLDSHIAG